LNEALIGTAFTPASMFAGDLVPAVTVQDKSLQQP